jgi:DNA-binding CsgD family transcriptional regulator
VRPNRWIRRGDAPWRCGRTSRSSTAHRCARTCEPSFNGHHQNRLALQTARDRQLLQLLGEGLSNREIAERLGLAVKTVKNYVSTLLAKLNLTNRTQAAVLATELRTGDGPPVPDGPAHRHASSRAVRGPGGSSIADG